MERIKVTTIDESIPLERNISIIHLDVEGYEKEVLSGGLKTIQRCLPILVLETLPQQDWLDENIFRFGYQFIGRVHRNTVLSVTQNKKG